MGTLYDFAVEITGEWERGSLESFIPTTTCEISKFKKKKLGGAATL